MSATVVEPNVVQYQKPSLPTAEPCVVVIFGATGDLTKRKLMPALCCLADLGCLDDVHILGIGRNPMSEGDFQTLVHNALEASDKLERLDDKEWADFSARLHYMAGELDDANTYQQISTRLEDLVREGASKNRLFYLATPPSLFSLIVEQLGESGLNKEDGYWSRIVIEKPFGHDLESAKALNAEVLQVFKESQVYRIDHYLGKETVQNILVFRFGNSMFEPIWNRNYVDYVEITAAETVGVGS